MCIHFWAHIELILRLLVRIVLFAAWFFYLADIFLLTTSISPFIILNSKTIRWLSQCQSTVPNVLFHFIQNVSTQKTDLGKISLWKQIRCVRAVQATLPTFFTFACRMDGFSFALCMRYNDNCASMGLVTLCVWRQLYQLQSDVLMRLRSKIAHTIHQNTTKKSYKSIKLDHLIESSHWFDGTLANVFDGRYRNQNECLSKLRVIIACAGGAIEMTADSIDRPFQTIRRFAVKRNGLFVTLAAANYESFWQYCSGLQVFFFVFSSICDDKSTKIEKTIRSYSFVFLHSFCCWRISFTQFIKFDPMFYGNSGHIFIDIWLKVWNSLIQVLFFILSLSLVVHK